MHDSSILRDKGPGIHPIFITAVFRKSDPDNNLVLGLESDPKSKRARLKFILRKLCRKFYRKKRSQTEHIFNNFLILMSQNR